MINRRDAFKTCLGAAATTLVSPLLAGDDSSQPIWKTAIGLNGFMSSARKYGKTYPIWEVLDYAARAGFDGVELVQGWPMGNYPTSNESQRITALRRLYDNYGLQVFSLQAGGGGAFSADAGARNQFLQRARDQIAFAKAVGCECIGLWPSGPLRGQTIDQAIEHLADSMRQFAKMAHDVGITAAFEIEPPFAFHSEQHLKQILAEADDPRVRTIYDSSHFDLFNGSQGKPHELLKRIGVDQIGYVHFTDTDGTIRDGGTSKHLAAGDGHINVPASFQTLKAGGFRGWIMVDTWQIPDPYDASTKGLQAIQHAMAG